MRGLIPLLLVLMLSFGCLEALERIKLNVSYEEPPPPAPELSPDAAHYYRLKNLSCGTLSGDFLIATHDVSVGSISGLVEEKEGELLVAQEILADYDTEETTRTYVRGDQMKAVKVSGGRETTVIWKDGRVYNCTPSCTMRIMDQEDSSYYQGMLAKMRERCMFFGKTEMPSHVNMSQLLQINRTGQVQTEGFRCDNFVITGNKSYARELLTENFTGDQIALLWGIEHFDGPVTECLDDGTGLIAFRDLTLDLTDSYHFYYSKDGYMKVNQQTSLDYFTDNVPESFMAVPS